jgi:hypothetical protein
MSAAAIKLGLLILASIPLLIYNLRTGGVKNALIGAILATGVIVAFFGPQIGAAPLTFFTLLGWVLAAVCLVGAAILCGAPGGIAKFLIALLPWFSIGDYLMVIVIGMFLTVVVCLITRRSAAIVPPMMAASLAIGLMNIFDVNFL